jgi:hypothetical protein
MSDMQIFYKKINAQSQTPTPYQFALKKLTHLDPSQLKSIATNLAWVDWGTPTSMSAAHH